MVEADDEQHALSVARRCRRGSFQHGHRPATGDLGQRGGKHVSDVFAKLGLPPDDAQHRRALAVLAYPQGLTATPRSTTQS